VRDFKLTGAHKQLLRARTIDRDGPGAVLHDFQTLLDFVGPQGVKAAGKYNLLPLDVLDALDQRLSRPLRLGLKRPQLRSHPYLQGLHLLLRASGLTRVEGTGEKARLVVDPAARAAWDRLNPTEQYFTLLEAWLRVGRPEMVGERGGGFGRMPGMFAECLMAWRSIPHEGLQFDLRRPLDVYLPTRLGRDFYQVALMDLFGLVEVDHPNSPVQPWCPASLRHTPFGDAVFTLLSVQVFSLGRLRRGEEDEGAVAGPAFGRWQSLFQPYFPEWRQVWSVPKPEAREGTFVFRVSLGKVWRRIAIPAAQSLDSLVSGVLKSVNFDYDHLYEISYRDRFGATVRVMHPACDEGPWGDEVKVGEVPLEVGQSMNLLYDFGDSWRFTIKLERIEPAGKRGKPRILESHGKAPEQYPDWE